VKPPAWDDDKALVAWVYEQLKTWWEGRWEDDEWWLGQPLGSLNLHAPSIADPTIADAENLDFTRLCGRLRSGRVTPGLLRWLADAIERGVFAARKGRREKLRAPSQRAVCDLPNVERMLALAFPEKTVSDVHDKAMWLVVIRHGDGDEQLLRTVENLVKRGRRDRRRVA
jgi:hypothetical protein